MKNFISFLISVGLTLFGVLSISAQKNQNANQPTNPKTADDDIAIIANVRARELKIEVVPNTNVEFPGTHERKTVWEDKRQNLPRPVQPGVTYRNIGIQLRITSRFADIERIVAEALGEIPVTDDAPNNQQPANAPNSTQTQPQASPKPQTVARRIKPRRRH